MPDPATFPCASCRCPASCLAARLGNARMCDLADPAHPEHDPAYAALVCRGAASAPTPTLARKALDLAGAAARFVASGARIASPEVAAARLATCAGCPFFRPDQTCGRCGCYMPLKAKGAALACPEGKWGPDPPESA